MSKSRTPKTSAVHPELMADYVEAATEQPSFEQTVSEVAMHMTHANALMANGDVITTISVNILCLEISAAPVVSPEDRRLRDESESITLGLLTRYGVVRAEVRQ